MNHTILIVLSLALLGAIAHPTHAQADLRGGYATVGYAFTYQGQLNDNGMPANGLYDMRFTIFTDTGDQIGSPVFLAAISVTDGSFSVELEFEDELWTDTPSLEKHLEVGVRPAGGGAYTTLTPRTKLTATPHANIARRLVFPYSDFGFGPDFLVPTFELIRGTDGPVVQFRSTTPSDRPVALVQGESIYNYDLGAFNGALQVDAPADKVGILAYGDTVSVLGVLRAGLFNDSKNRSAIVGQVGFDADPTYSAISAQNMPAQTFALFARGTLAGDFTGDILSRDDLRVQGELTEDYLSTSGTGDPSRAAPLAYGTVSSVGAASNQTANFSSVWDAGASRYIISIHGLSAGSASSDTVLVTPRSSVTPYVANYEVIGGDFVVTIWNLLTNAKAPAPFSIMIYDAEPGSIVDAPTESPDGSRGSLPAGMVEID